MEARIRTSNGQGEGGNDAIAFDDEKRSYRRKSGGLEGKGGARTVESFKEYNGYLEKVAWQDWCGYVTYLPI
jgi:hypothetical protein